MDNPDFDIDKIFDTIKEKMAIPKKKKIVRNLSDEQKASILDRLNRGKERKRREREAQKTTQEPINQPPATQEHIKPAEEPKKTEPIKATQEPIKPAQEPTKAIPDIDLMIKKMMQMSEFMDNLKTKAEQMPKTSKTPSVQATPPQEVKQQPAKPTLTDAQAKYNKKLLAFKERIKNHNI